MYEHLLYSVEAGVATITLNRPEVFNAINDKISYELQDALKKATFDSNVRVVVFTAAGEKAFCSGQDLKEIAGKKDRSLADSIEKRYNPIVKLMRNMSKPIIGRINGVAAGAGCSFALACDMVIAAEHVNFIEIFINIGLVLDSGSSFFLPRLVGTAKAFELATMGTKVSATEAQQIGLIYKACPMAELDNEVKKLTDYYATAPTKAVGLMKRMLNKSMSSSLDEALEYERQCQAIAGSSSDYREGTTAFAEKRKPNFTGA